MRPVRISSLMRRALFVAGALGAILAGCSGGKDAPPLELEILREGGDLIGQRIAARNAAPRPVVNRALLDTLPGPLLEVTLESREQLAYLYVNSQRRDSDPGLIIIWRTDDDITLTMRNGVLIATRGFGGDIVSSLVQVSAHAPGPASGGERVQHVRALDNKELRLALVCDLDDLGSETVVIFERAHATRHLRETCTGGTAADGSGEVGRVVNDYWVDSRSQVVWQSRQWAGPYIGYVRTRRLIK